MRTDAAVEEPLDTDEIEVRIESDAPPAVLCEPAPKPLAPESDLRDVRRRHLAFKQTGRAKELGLPTAGEMLPLPLFPYREFDALRGDYPICVFKDSLYGPTPLSRVVDGILEASGLEGDDLERSKRWALQVEARMRRVSLGEADHSLYALWNRCSEELSMQYRDDPERQKKLHADLAALRKHIPSDAALVGCNRETAGLLLEAVARAKSTHAAASAATELRVVVGKLADLLALEDEESDEGLNPEHLREAVGEGFQSDLDFDVLSSILHDAPHGESLTPSRKARIERIVETITGYLDHIDNRRNALRRLHETETIREIVHEMLVQEERASRAWMAAKLEISGRFDEERHGALLHDNAKPRWGQSISSQTPISPIHLDARGGLSAGDLASLQELFDRSIPVRVLVTIGSCVAGEASGQSEPYLPPSAGERLVMSGSVGRFLCQRSLSDVDGLIEAMGAFLGCDGTAVMIVYDGSDTGDDRLHEYLKSAAGSEARVVPTFVYDVRKGSNWAERFSLAGNDQLARVWPASTVDVASPEGTVTGQEAVFSAASLMLCEPAFVDHFSMIDPAEWHQDLVPLEEYSGEADLVPYLRVASKDGHVHRAICSDHVYRQTARVAARWMNIRELGGIENSHAAKAVADAAQRLEAEHRDRLAAVEAEHQSLLATTTGKLAEEIVANIAAGLLSEASTGPLPVAPRRAAPATPVVKRQEEDLQETEETVETPPEEADDELEILDEAYVETPRCTACDECTTLNPRLFAYNENKQAYIVDPAAGTYRELVLAAEKCPVRIIHPGKPLNSDEPHLDELLKRAEPFR